jgi:hypothetical protein
VDRCSSETGGVGSKGIVMAHAVADLPDPMETGVSPSGANADDLLSELAGQEIDRLLAEADGDGVPAEPAHVVAHSPAATPAVETQHVGSVAVPAVPEASGAALLGDEDLNAVLASVAAERQALQSKPASPLGPLPAAVEGSLKGTQSIEIDLDPESKWAVLLRPLVWINSPLDAWPDAVRDAIGKIGLLTLFNAAAVIAYVLIFRRHH